MGRSIHDKNQPLLPGFDGTRKEAVTQVYEDYAKMGRTLQDIIRESPARPETENEFELCNEIAVLLNQGIRDSGMSRDEFAEEVNLFLGRTDDRHKFGECRKPLTRADIEKWISDAPARPIHAYYLYAFQHILGFGVANGIVGAKGGQVVSQEDRRLLALAQIGELEARIRDAKKVLKQ